MMITVQRTQQEKNAPLTFQILHPNLSTWFKFYQVKTGCFCSEHHLTSLKNAMEQGGRKKERESNANEMGGPGTLLISHLY